MISIVIPTYNEEKYLPKLLDSIKKQSFKDYEIIIADNNSKDKTRQIAKKYGCKIVKGGSPAEGRNNGGKAAKYDILFMDADTILLKNFLKNFLNLIKENKLDIATCVVKSTSNKFSHKLFYLLKNLGVIVFQKYYSHANGQCFYTKNEIFEKTGFRKKIKHGDEHDYIMRAKEHGKFKVFTNI